MPFNNHLKPNDARTAQNKRLHKFHKYVPWDFLEGHPCVKTHPHFPTFILRKPRRRGLFKLALWTTDRQTDGRTDGRTDSQSMIVSHIVTEREKKIERQIDRAREGQRDGE